MRRTYRQTQESRKWPQKKLFGFAKAKLLLSKEFYLFD